MECKETLGSLATVARELSRYQLHLVGVQEVRFDIGGKVTAGDCIFFMEKETKQTIGNRFCCTPQNSTSS